MKSLVQAAIFAVVMASSASAGSISPNDPVAITVEPATVYWYNVLYDAPTTINDTFTFQGGADPITATLQANIIVGAGGPQSLSLSWIENGVNQIAQWDLTTSAQAVAFTFLAGVEYALTITGTVTGAGYGINVTTTPIPPAVLLFGSALAGLGFLGRRKRRQAMPAAL